MPPTIFEMVLVYVALTILSFIAYSWFLAWRRRTSEKMCWCGMMQKLAAGKCAPIHFDETYQAFVLVDKGEPKTVPTDQGTFTVGGDSKYIMWYCFCCGGRLKQPSPELQLPFCFLCLSFFETFVVAYKLKGLKRLEQFYAAFGPPDETQETPMAVLQALQQLPDQPKCPTRIMTWNNAFRTVFLTVTEFADGTVQRSTELLKPPKAKS